MLGEISWVFRFWKVSSGDFHRVTLQRGMVSRRCWPLLTTHYHIRLRSKLICYHLQGWRAKESLHPIVTGDEEVISALRVVPKRVPLSHGVDIVFDESGEREHGARVWNVEMGHHLLDAVGEEEHVCLLWIVCEVLACALHARYELPLGGVDSCQQPRVDE